MSIPLTQVNSKKQGDVGLGVAIGVYTSLGYTVSIPLTDSQDYDLVVEVDGQLKKVQIKTTRYKLPSGSYKCNLSVKGGNQSFNTVKKFNNQNVDIIFVLTGDNSKYSIPSSEIKTVDHLVLSKNYDEFILAA